MHPRHVPTSVNAPLVVEPTSSPKAHPCHLSAPTATLHAQRVGQAVPTTRQRERFTSIERTLYKCIIGIFAAISFVSVSLVVIFARSRRAFFDQALREEAKSGRYSFLAAFERAKQLVADQEKAAGFEPSNPQIHIGTAMREKLKLLEAKLQERARNRVPPEVPVNDRTAQVTPP